MHALTSDMRRRLVACAGETPAHMLVVHVGTQSLDIVRDGRMTASYPVSTSRWGVGNRDGSFKTPDGIHRVAEKIGGGAPMGRVFRDRIDTGENVGGQSDENLILTRILRLEGLEEGRNRGAGIDSYERFIYIHGTNHEDAVGTPFSHGCVVMRNADVIEVYNAVEVGTIVVID
jgi:hypothetical protein